MTTLRIFAPAADGGKLRWSRIDRDGKVLSQGGEAELGGLEVEGLVELIVPAERALLIPARLTEEQRSRLSDENVPWLAEPHLVQEVERMHVVRGDLTSEGVTLCAVEQAWLAGIVGRLGASGIKPGRIVPESFIADWRPGSWTVVSKPEGGFVRIGPQQALLLDLPRNGEPPAVLRMALRQGEPAAGLRLFHTSGLQPDLAAWQLQLGVPVTVAGEWDPAATISEHAIDLARGSFAPPGKGRNLLRRLRPTLWLLAGVALLNLAGMIAAGAMGFVERQRIQAEMENLLKTAFPDTKAVLDPVQQMRQNVERLSRNAGIPTRRDFIPMLGIVAQAIGKQASGRIEVLTFETGRLTLELGVAGAAEVDALKKALANAGVAAQVETLPASANGQRVRVSITS